MNNTEWRKLQDWYTIYRQTDKNQDALDHIAHAIWDIVERETKHIHTEKLRKTRRVTRALDIMDELRKAYTE
jgi:predicted metalloprotease with PDZ domain